METRIILLVLLFGLARINSFSQDSTSKFYPEANGTVGSRKNINALSFMTQNETAPFFEAVKKEFGTPIREDRFLRYDTRNKDWGEGKIVLRISEFIQIDLDQTKSKSVFIFVETMDQQDLLKPNTKSYEKIKQYFLNLFNETIRNGSPETFK